MPNATELVRQLAAHTLREFSSHVDALVLDPELRLSDRDLEVIVRTRDTLLDAMFVGDSRLRTRGLSGSTDAEQWSRTFQAGFSVADASQRLKRLNHSIALLQRAFGPQPMDVCARPHAELDHGSQRDG